MNVSKELIEELRKEGSKLSIKAADYIETMSISVNCYVQGYDSMIRTLQFRTNQVRELQEEIARLKDVSRN